MWVWSQILSTYFPGRSECQAPMGLQQISLETAVLLVCVGTNIAIKYVLVLGAPHVNGWVAVAKGETQTIRPSRLSQH